MQANFALMCQYLVIILDPIIHLNSFLLAKLLSELQININKEKLSNH